MKFFHSINYLLCIFLIVFTSTKNLHADKDTTDNKYFFPGFGKYISGFGYGPLIKFSQVGDKFLDGSGGGGGLVLFQQVLVGYYGHGTTSQLKLNNNTKVAFLQSGALIAYRLFRHKKIHPFMSVYYGPANLNFFDANDEPLKTISFQLLEPMLNVEFNLSPGMTTVVGMGYKFGFGDDMYLGCSKEDVSGVSVCMTFFFGNF